MRVSNLLPLAALATAIVIPDERVMSNINAKSRGKLSQWKDSISHAIGDAKHAVEDAVGDALDETNNAVDKFTDYVEEEYSEAESWAKDFRKAHQPDLEAFSEPIDSFSSVNLMQELKHKTKKWYKDLELSYEPCPHKQEEDEDHDGHDGHHGKRPHRPHHPPHHHKPNLTVYQLIKKSKYTTKLAKLVDRFPVVVEKLNGSESNFTFFAPTDKAFEKVPDHAKPSEEFLLKLLQYHVVPDVYPAFRVLKSNTLPTVLEGEGLSDSPRKTPQRLSIRLSLFKGVAVNFYSRVVAVNIFGTNGVIHGIDSILVPPPKATTIVQAFPGGFSTLELALWKTGLIHALNDTSNHLGGTLFAPNNNAFAKLGPRANAFLFSKYGQKYLKALLKYHVVPNITLYSDAIYVASKKHHKHEDDQSIDASRTFHIDLPTLLKGKSLSIDVARWTRFVDIRINGFYNVAVQNAPAYDGVLQILTNVLIPPKEPHGRKADVEAEDISVEDLKERLEPFVDNDDDYELDDVKVDDFHREQLPLGLPMEL